MLTENPFFATRNVETEVFTCNLFLTCSKIFDTEKTACYSFDQITTLQIYFYQLVKKITVKVGSIKMAGCFFGHLWLVILYQSKFVCVFFFYKKATFHRLQVNLCRKNLSSKKKRHPPLNYFLQILGYLVYHLIYHQTFFTCSLKLFIYFL